MLPASDVQKRLRQALRNWPKTYIRTSPLEALQLFRYELKEQKGNVQQATNQVLQRAIDDLAREYVDYADVLRSRYIENEKIESATGRLNISRATFHRKRTEALPLLTETVLRLEERARSEFSRLMQNRLEEQTYTELFGQQERLETLETILKTPEAPWIITLAGIGGIGKTSMADALVRSLIHQSAFYEFGWVTARQSIFNAGGSIKRLSTPALTVPILVESLCSQLLGSNFHRNKHTYEESLAILDHQLHYAPHLIIIDNLETLVDIETLLPLLRRLANPSKFLLTIRDSLHDEPDIYHTVLSELGQEDSIALIRSEAEIRNIPTIMDADEAELLPIYETVGGNPLALRLIAGQLNVHPLASILSDLLAAHSKRIEAMYEHIYRRAWDLLAPAEREVFVAMPLINEQGGGVELIAAMCDISTDETRRVLERLVRLNLVDVRGGLHQRSYMLHGLTRTFLHQQVLHWTEAEFDQMVMSDEGGVPLSDGGRSLENASETRQKVGV